MDDINDYIRVKISTEFFKPLVENIFLEQVKKKMQIFEGFKIEVKQHALLGEISKMIKIKLTSPEDIIVNRFDANDQIYFISQGKCRVFHEEHHPMLHLEIEHQF